MLARRRPLELENPVSEYFSMVRDRFFVVTVFHNDFFLIGTVDSFLVTDQKLTKYRWITRIRSRI